jgi:hypothetical protein
VVFDALGQVNITGLKDITHTLTDGLIALGREENVSCLLFNTLSCTVPKSLHFRLSSFLVLNYKCVKHIFLYFFIIISLALLLTVQSFNTKMLRFAY